MTQITQAEYEDVRDQLLNENTYDLTHNLDGTKNKDKLTVTQTVMDSTWTAYQNISDAECNDTIFMKLQLPLTRRVVPNLLAWELMGVQAIKKDLDQIYALQLTYKNSESNDNLSAVSKETSKQLAIQIVKLIANATQNKFFNVNFNGYLDDSDIDMSNMVYRELLDALTYEIISELDVAVLVHLRKISSIDFDYDQSKIVNPVAKLSRLQKILKFFRLYKDTKQTPITLSDQHAGIILLINRACNRIAARSRRGAGNWVVVSPTALTILGSSNSKYFSPASRDNADMPHAEYVPSRFVGTLCNDIKVYCDPYARDDTPVLVGFKGSGEIDSGIFLAIYQLVQQALKLDPISFMHINKISAQYELVDNNTNVSGANDYYSQISINTKTLSFI